MKRLIITLLLLSSATGVATEPPRVATPEQQLRLENLDLRQQMINAQYELVSLQIAQSRATLVSEVAATIGVTVDKIDPKTLALKPEPAP